MHPLHDSENNENMLCGANPAIGPKFLPNGCCPAAHASQQNWIRWWTHLNQVCNMCFTSCWVQINLYTSIFLYYMINNCLISWRSCSVFFAHTGGMSPCHRFHRLVPLLCRQALNPLVVSDFWHCNEWLWVRVHHGAPVSVCWLIICWDVPSSSTLFWWKSLLLLFLRTLCVSMCRRKTLKQTNLCSCMGGPVNSPVALWLSQNPAPKFSDHPTWFKMIQHGQWTCVVWCGSTLGKCWAPVRKWDLAPSRSPRSSGNKALWV